MTHRVGDAVTYRLGTMSRRAVVVSVQERLGGLEYVVRWQSAFAPDGRATVDTRCPASMIEESKP